MQTSNTPNWKAVVQALKGAPTYTKRTSWLKARRKWDARNGHDRPQHPYLPVPKLDALWRRAYS